MSDIWGRIKGEVVCSEDSSEKNVDLHVPSLAGQVRSAWVFLAFLLADK